MNKNDKVRIKITDLNNLGCGVGRLPDGRVIFVAGGVTGDTVEAKIIKVNSGYCVGRLISVAEPSAVRLKYDPCTAPESCGGCVYRHITYEHELDLKRSYVKNAFIKAGLPDIEVGNVLATGKTQGYRNKAQYPVRESKNGLIAGFFSSGTHRVVGDGSCPLQPKIFSEIVAAVLDYASANSVSAYNEENGKGILRHIYIRRADGTGEIMLCPVLKAENSSFGVNFADYITERFPDIVSVYVNYNRKNTNVITGDEYRLIGGKDCIEDVLCGLRFLITPASFWQVNHDGAELLYGVAREKASLTGKENLLDLYCGTGSIGLTMAGSAASLTGIEIVPDAVECARRNAKLNGIDNADFFCGDASETGGILARAERELGRKINADTVILDPPRKGSTPELISYIAGRGIGRVVYVSCNPDTLARDCVEFSRNGYKIEGEVVPVDMFPRTGHVESVVSLTRGFDNELPLA